MKRDEYGAAGSQATMTYREAAMVVLKNHGPLHYGDLANIIVQEGLVYITGKTPAASLNSIIAGDIKRRGTKSAFVRVQPGVFALREAGEQTDRTTLGSVVRSDEVNEAADDDANLRVRVPLFPVYSELRHLLRVWPGWPRKQVTGFRSKIVELRGTPKDTVDWTDPATWIPKRLSGDDRELAQAIWDKSNGEVNPRHTYGHWLLAQRYGLLRDDHEGLLELTEAGRDFLGQPGGKIESEIDEVEGLIKLLSIVADNGPTQAGGLVEEWGDYLRRCSKINRESYIKDTMRRRLVNLSARGLVERKGNIYSATQDGLTYLQKTRGKGSLADGHHNQLIEMIRKHKKTVRESLRERLQDMDPYSFEHLIKQLLEDMAYQNVEVTAQSGDGGVDVVADIELGITSVREVVQVKRHSRPIQRKDLDALRGSLYRFDAVRGTIVTTSRFAKGAQEAAFARGAAPITLVDGEKLVDLLIEHGIGVRKRTIELLEVDTDTLAAIEKGN